MYSHTILFQPARDLRDRHESLRTLEQLRTGWRPDSGVLAAARQAERWMIHHPADAPVFQFVGYRAGPAEQSSLVIGTLLAIEPPEGWALLAGNSWVALGQPSPEQLTIDSRAVRHRAEAWLRAS
jgi:hypothetical protein